MSYIPPHKRNLKDPVRPSPVPDSLVTNFKKNIDFKSSSVKGIAIGHSGDFISKWFLIGSNGIEDEVPPSVKLVPLSSNSSERIDGVKPLVLKNNDFQKVNITTEASEEEEERTRWLLLAEKVEEDLLLAYEQAKKAMEDPHLLDNAKLRLVARFGKMIFYGRQAGPVAEYSQENSKRVFSTDVPNSFIQNIKAKAVASHELFLDVEKEVYIVNVSHYTRPNTTIFCKCTIKEDGRISMYKALLNPVRHLVVDVSCIDKNLDMRLMLGAISRWFPIGSNVTEDDVSPSLKLVPVSLASAERRNEEKYFVLMNNNIQKADMTTEEKDEEERNRWMLVAEKVEEDLVLAYEKAKKWLIEDRHHGDNAKLRLVARFGKILFYGRQAGPVAECSLRTNKIFSTDVPTSFIQNIKSKAIPSHGFCIGEDKETYIVKVSHYTHPEATISCKCTIKEDGWLSMYKTELNHVRHLVVDVSCIDKSLDMRLMLAANRKIMALTEKEMSNIKELLDSVTVDPNVKGGVRWTLGSSRDGYRIFEVCHVRATIFKKETLRLKVRETDSFNEWSGTGEIKRGVTLILHDINTKLQEKDIKRGCVMEMLRDALGTIWDLLRCDANL